MLRSLQYFEAVARLGSVKAASAEIGISPSGISHQISELTSFLGEELLVRSGRGIKLTESGKRVYEHISPMFSNLGEVLEGVIGRKKRYLRLGVCSSFGPYWLAERLPEFKRAHPNIDLELHLFSQYPLQSEQIADAVVTTNPVSDGFDSVTLFAEELVAVASPNADVGKDGMPTQLITTDVRPSELGQDWRDYSKHTGRDFIDASTNAFIPCTHYIIALAMARAGLGAALIPDYVATEAINAGELILVDQAGMPSGQIYKLCFKASRARDPDLRSLSRWIKSHAKGGSYFNDASESSNFNLPSHRHHH